MIRLTFSEADVKAMDHERYHHPHPQTTAEEAMMAIERLTGIRRSPGWVRHFSGCRGVSPGCSSAPRPGVSGSTSWAR